MKKEILFFTEMPPSNQEAIHIWLGKSTHPHEELLKNLIQRYLGSPPREFLRSPTGKLSLPDSNLHFNLSDSEDWIAVAFSFEAPVGIDIEMILPIEGMDELILEHFSSREQAYTKEKDSLSRFWEIWNKKEACCKALGVGLQEEMSNWDCFGRDWVAVDQVFVKSVPMPNHLSGAVAIKKGGHCPLSL